MIVLTCEVQRINQEILNYNSLISIIFLCFFSLKPMLSHYIVPKISQYIFSQIS